MESWSPNGALGRELPRDGVDTLPLSGVRILVVEDEPLIAMCVEAALQEFGAIVLVAMNEADAHRLLEQVCSFELLITDINLGGGTSGFDIARAARQRDRTTAVIYLSGRSESGLRREGVARAAYLSKPVSEARLIGAAVQAVEAMRQADAG